jgi:hypothetical protein
MIDPNRLFLRKYSSNWRKAYEGGLLFFVRPRLRPFFSRIQRTVRCVGMVVRIFTLAILALALCSCAGFKSTTAGTTQHSCRRVPGSGDPT